MVNHVGEWWFIVVLSGLILVNNIRNMVGLGWFISSNDEESEGKDDNNNQDDGISIGSDN